MAFHAEYYEGDTDVACRSQDSFNARILITNLKIRDLDVDGRTIFTIHFKTKGCRWTGLSS